MRWLAPLLIALLVMASGCLSGGGEKVEAPKTLEIGSVFHEGDFIPKEYTCDGDDINPPLYVGKIPEGTKSLVVIVDDPDAPGGTFTHWIAWNIPPLGEIPQWIPKKGETDEPIHIVQGRNDFGRIGYNGPCPPPGKAHHYHFKVYALDTELSLKPGSGREELEKAMEGHVLAWGELVGLYQRG